MIQAPSVCPSGHLKDFTTLNSLVSTIKQKSITSFFLQKLAGFSLKNAKRFAIIYLVNGKINIPLLRQIQT